MCSISIYINFVLCLRTFQEETRYAKDGRRSRYYINNATFGVGKILARYTLYTAPLVLDSPSNHSVKVHSVIARVLLGKESFEIFRLVFFFFKIFITRSELFFNFRFDYRGFILWFLKWKFNSIFKRLKKNYYYFFFSDLVFNFWMIIGIKSFRKFFDHYVITFYCY